MTEPAHYQRLRWLLLAMVIATLVLTGVGLVSIDHSDRHGSQINFASRQRMLSQRMHRTLLQLAQPTNTESHAQELQRVLDEASREFNTVLIGFANGYEGPDYLGTPVRLPPLSDEMDVRAQVEQAMSLWQRYYRLIRPLGTTQAVTPQALGPALQFADQYTDELLSLMDQLTRQIATSTRDELRFLRRFELSLAMLILALGVWTYRLKRQLKSVEQDAKSQLENESSRLDSELSDSRLQLQDMMTVSADLVWVKNEQGAYQSCNAAYESFHGQSARGLVGVCELDLYEAQQSMQERMRDNQLMAHGQSIHAEARFTSAVDGISRLFELVRTPLHHADGTTAGVQTVARDITARRQTEVDLTIAHHRLSLFEKCIANLNDAVVITEAELRPHSGRRIQFVNAAFERMTGYTLAEVQGRAPGDVLQGPKTEPVQVETMRKALSTWQTVHTEVLNYTKDGSEFWVELVITPIADGSNGDWYTHWVAIQRDITHRKQAQVEMGLLYERAMESSRLKSEFMATVSHEIRTPMNGVVGMADLLLDTPLTKDQREYANAIAQGGKDLMVIIKDILDFSRIEAGLLRLQTGPTALRAVVDASMAAYAVIASQKGLTLEAHVATDVPEVVVADEERLQQVLHHLLTNALKFTQRGSVQLSVSSTKVGRGDPGIRFEVCDTGIGIAPADQTTLFEPFRQVDGSITRKYGGTGLGLAICKQLVALMRGRIGVRSQESEGSLFWFEVPAGAAPTGDGLAADNAEKSA